MAAIWNRIGQLCGRPLQTLSRKNPFEIVEINPEFVRVLPHKGKKVERRVPRIAIETVASITSDAARLRRCAEQEFPNSQVTSYVAAIVHAVMS